MANQILQISQNSSPARMSRAAWARRRRRRMLRRRAFFVTSVLLAAALGGVTLSAAIGRFPVRSVPPASPAESQAQPAVLPEPPGPPFIAFQDLALAAVPQTRPAGEGGAEQKAAADASRPAPEKAVPQTPVGYDYSQPVPESAAAEQGFFDNTLFFGNSITDGIARFGISPGSAVYAKNGLTVTDALSEPIVPQGNGKISAAQALEGQSFDKIYLMFGMNELGWSSEEVFIQRYSDLIDQVWRLQPEAAVYVQSILPVTAEKSADASYFTNERVNRFNQLLQQMCAEKHALFLDTHAALADETGALPADAAGPDGIHIKKSAYQTWFTYVQTHIWGGKYQ